MDSLYKELTAVLGNNFIFRLHYNGAVASATNFHTIWIDGREGNPDTYAGGIVTSPLLADPIALETYRLTPATTTITVIGGVGLFQGKDVQIRQPPVMLFPMAASNRI